MSVNVVVDHRAVARSRVALQYQNSPRFLAYLDALATPANELEDVFHALAYLMDIDTMTGVNLDVIGEIVGISRILPQSIAVQFFGFEGQPGSTVFGENGVLGIGARFREEGESDTDTTVLADPEFRLLIRAKIVKNHSKGTNEDILKGLAYLFNAPRTVVEDLGGMAIGVAIGRMLTFQEKAMVTVLDILPRPTGVRINWRSTFDASRYFGFDGQTDAMSFGEEGQPAVGGFFAEEF